MPQTTLTYTNMTHVYPFENGKNEIVISYESAVYNVVHYSAPSSAVWIENTRDCRNKAYCTVLPQATFNRALYFDVIHSSMGECKIKLFCNTQLGNEIINSSVSAAI